MRNVMVWVRKNQEGNAHMPVLWELASDRTWSVAKLVISGRYACTSFVVRHNSATVLWNMDTITEAKCAAEKLVQMERSGKK